MSYIERKSYREIPYPLATEEWKSFLNYAKAYYKEAIEIAKECANDEASYRSLLTATISPLVYIWERWQLMTLDARLPYATPAYKVEIERIKAESQKVKDVVAKEKWAEK